MSSATINFPPYQAKTKITADEPIGQDAHRSLLLLYNGHPLIQLSTVNGPATFTVPLARLNQNVEITYVKISADGNVPTLNASGTDLINGPASWGQRSYALSPLQGSKVKLKSDGQNNWYVVG